VTCPGVRVNNRYGAVPGLGTSSWCSPSAARTVPPAAQAQPPSEVGVGHGVPAAGQPGGEAGLPDLPRGRVDDGRKGRPASVSMRPPAVCTVLHASGKKPAPAALRLPAWTTQAPGLSRLATSTPR
jgi:hypothetical protein